MGGGSREVLYVYLDISAPSPSLPRAFKNAARVPSQEARAMQLNLLDMTSRPAVDYVVFLAVIDTLGSNARNI